MKNGYRFFIVIAFVLFSVFYANAEVSYRLRVIEQEISGTDFLFKIYLQSTGDNLYLGTSQIYLDFNNGNFTSPVASREVRGSDISYYSLTATIDGNNRIAINIGQPAIGDDTDFNERVALISTVGNGTYIGQFKITNISNPSGTAGLSWYYSGTDGTDIYYLDNFDPWNAHQITSYSNVAPDDQSLPVHMSAFSALAIESEGIQLIWNTQSEVNNLGFHVWRSTAEDAEYQCITNEIIPGQGNCSNVSEYKYLDRNVNNGVEYWYKIEEISLEGTSQFFGPVIAAGVSLVPIEFGLSANYPNPFNPSTNFSYEISEPIHTTIRVYNLLGKMVKELVNERLEPGYYNNGQWDGLDSYGNQVTSGIYFLLLEAGTYKKMQKMTLVR